MRNKLDYYKAKNDLHKAAQNPNPKVRAELIEEWWKCYITKFYCENSISKKALEYYRDKKDFQEYIDKDIHVRLGLELKKAKATFTEIIDGNIYDENGEFVDRLPWADMEERKRTTVYVLRMP